MKKVLIVVFSILILLSLTGCSDKEENVKEKQKYFVTINTIDKGSFIYSVNDGEKTEASLITLEIEEGSKLSIKTFPNDGFKFVRWLNNDKAYSSNKDLVVTVKSNMNLMGEFDK